MPHLHHLAGAALVAMLVGASAQAVPIAYEFNGSVFGLQKDAVTLLPGAQVGDAFQLRLWLDDGLQAIGAGSTTASYGEGFGMDRGAGFVSAIQATMRVGGEVLALAFPGTGTVDSPVNSLAVMDGNRIFYGNGVQVDVEGLQWTAMSSRGFNTPGSAFLRYWNEHPVGTVLTGPAGVVNGTGLPTSLVGVGTVSPRADFGFFWGAPDQNFLQSFIGANLTSANVVLNAAANPAPTVAWPQPGGGGNGTPGASVDNPLLPGDVFNDPMTGGSTFVFQIDNATPGTTVWIDPPVAVGYAYALGPDAPLQSFLSVVVGTHVGDDLFTVQWVDVGTGLAHSSSVVTGEVLSFGAGAQRFEITGIEPEAQLDPANPLAFVVGVTFAEAGPLTVYQTSLVADYNPVPVPEPGTWGLMLAGLLGLGQLRRRRC